MHYLDLLLLFSAGLAGGFLNALVGGGWFIVFPSFFNLGLSPVVSNISTTATLLGGYSLGESPFQQSWNIRKNSFYIFGAAISGGMAGAFALVFFSPSIFESIGPWLLLFSWTIFVFQDSISARLRSCSQSRLYFEYSHIKLIPLFLMSIYGTYIGAGFGIILKLFFNFYGIREGSEIEKLKIFIINLNGISGMLIFVWSGIINWPYLLVTLAGAVLGARISRLLPKKRLPWKFKFVMVLFGALVTLYFLNLLYT